MLRYTIATGKAETNIETTYGVHVTASKGLVGRPELKNTSKKYDWDYLHGEWVDLNSLRYKAREITLSCWIKDTSEMNAVTKLNNFIKELKKNELIRLTITFLRNNGNPIDPGTPNANHSLFYLVRLSNPGNVTYKWHRGKQVLKFDITLTEPSPVKRVYKVVGTDVGSVTMTFTSTSEFDVYWGDGNKAIDNIGTEQSLTHAYGTVGTHYLIITGVISDISAMTLTTSTAEVTVTQIFDEI